MEYDTVTSIPAAEVGKALETEKAPVFDVRKSSEYVAEHLVDANNTPLGLLNDHLAEFPKEQDFYLHCAGGYRSMIAASILKSRGYHNLIDVAGGFEAMKESGMDITDHACPSGNK